MASLRGAKGTGAVRIYNQLRDEILTLTLSPGADLDEAGLVARFGLSRTPVREALIRLAADGLVALLPNRGAQVATIELSDIPRFFEAFDLAQRVVTRLAAIRRTDEDLRQIREAEESFEKAVATGDVLAMTACNRDFHLAVATASHNGYLIENYSRLLDEGLRLMRIPFAFDPASDSYSRIDHIQKISSEHQAIVHAIEAHHPDEADSLAQSHAELFRDRFMAYLNQNQTRQMDLARGV